MSFQSSPEVREATSFEPSRPASHHISAVNNFLTPSCWLFGIWPDGSSSPPSPLKPLKTQAVSSRKQQSNLARLPLPDCNLGPTYNAVSMESACHRAPWATHHVGNAHRPWLLLCPLCRLAYLEANL